MKAKTIFELFKESIFIWLWGDAAMHAAALAYYAIFSLAPLLIICIAIGSRIFSEVAVEGRIVTATENIIGEAGATTIEEIIKNSQNLTSSSLATGLSALFLLYGASSVFRQLRISLNMMWGIGPKVVDLHQSVITTVKNYLLSAVVVLAFGLLVLGSMILNALWTAMSPQYYDALIERLSRVIPLINLMTSPAIYAIIFALIFKTIPKAKIRWRDVWPGALVTALLFWLGSYLVGIYLGYSVWTSVYGAASSIIAILLWIYYSAWIFLFGAKFTQLYAEKFGVPIIPDSDTTFVSLQPFESLEPAMIVKEDQP